MNRLRFAGIAVVCFACFAGAPSSAALTFHVAHDGDDAHSGTEDAPFASLTRARDAVRAAKGDATPKEAVRVIVAPGVYTVSDTFALEAQDGGMENLPVEYRGDPDSGTVLQGGIALPPAAFTAAVSAPDAARLDKDASPNIVWADLKSLGAVELGVFPEQFIEPPNVPELFFGGERMTLAQWPNEGWAEIERVIESGPAPWRNYASDKPGAFVYSGGRPERWSNAPAIWLQGYWCFDWASETIRIAAIDTAAKTIALSARHGYGLGSGNPAPRRYRAVNLLEELDRPGEYCIERGSGVLYFWPPAPLENAAAVLSTLAGPVIAVNGANGIVLQNFTVTACRGNGIEVKDGKSAVIQNCTVFNTGLDGISVSGGAAHRVTRCRIHDTGTAGLRLSGGDRAALISCGHIASNNDIGFVSRRRLTHAFPVHIGGAGVCLSHNRLHDAPHQCIGLGGNDHVIEFNEIFNICQQSDDCGAFYMGRNPSERGSVIQFNYWHDIGGDFAHGACAVYFDDGAGGQKVYGNIFQRAARGSFGAVFSHGGHDNFVENNIFIDCKLALGSAPWNDSVWNDWLQGDLWRQRLLEEVDITSELYRGRYPELAGFMEPAPKPRANHARNNVFVRCGGDMNGNWTGENNWSTDGDPGFVTMEANAFSLRADAPVFEHVPGFKAIPFEEIGLEPGSE